MLGGVFHSRVFTGSRGAVQSLDGAAPGPVGRSARLVAFHPEPARHGRRATFPRSLFAAACWTPTATSRWMCPPATASSRCRCPTRLRKASVRAEAPGTRSDGRFQPAGSQRLAGRIHAGRTARQHQLAPSSSSRGPSRKPQERGQRNPDARQIQLRSAVRAGVALVRARPVPRHTLAEQRHRGCPLCPLSQRRRHAELITRLTPPTTAG